MGAIIQTPAIGEAIVGHRHMDAWPLLGLLDVFFLHRYAKVCTVLGDSAESSMTGQQGPSVPSLLNTSVIAKYLRAQC